MDPLFGCGPTRGYGSISLDFESSCYFTDARGAEGISLSQEDRNWSIRVKVAQDRSMTRGKRKERWCVNEIIPKSNATIVSEVHGALDSAP